MSNKRLESWTKNPLFQIEENCMGLFCPYCNISLVTATCILNLTLDGNQVYHCPNEDDHIFWQNPRGPADEFYEDSEADDERGKRDKVWFLVEGVLKNEK